MANLFFYLNFWARYFLKLFPNNIPELNDFPANDINYYCKLDSEFSIQNGIMLNDINLLKHSGYSYDIYRIIYPFHHSLRFNYLPGDITHIPPEPTFVKSRPICKGNENSILLPLDSRRHLRFAHDKLVFDQKKEGVVWRGAAYQESRKLFLRTCNNYNFVNLGNTAKAKGVTIEFAKPRLTISEQLKYKFIVSIEGNDVATNLKWIMSSNSVCMMPKPKFETWFKEGTLISGVHYIQLKDDFSDLEKQYNKYRKDPRACIRIAKQANEYANSFKSPLTNLLLARCVVSKYFKYLKRVSCSDSLK